MTRSPSAASIGSRDPRSRSPCSPRTSTRFHDGGPNGKFSAVVTIPDNIEPGPHTIVCSGIDRRGDPVVLAIAVTILGVVGGGGSLHRHDPERAAVDGAHRRIVRSRRGGGRGRPPSQAKRRDGLLAGPDQPGSAQDRPVAGLTSAPSGGNLRPVSTGTPSRGLTLRACARRLPRLSCRVLHALDPGLSTS